MTHRWMFKDVGTGELDFNNDKRYCMFKTRENARKDKNRWFSHSGAPLKIVKVEILEVT